MTNRGDEAAAERGYIPSNQVRSVELDHVLINTGARTLCLPKPVIDHLGLTLLKQVSVATATGISQAQIFQDAKINLLGREGTFECLELPGGRTPLLGVIPLEALGVEIDRHRSHPSVAIGVRVNG